MIDSEVGVRWSNSKICDSIVSCPHVTEIRCFHSDLSQFFVFQDSDLNKFLGNFYALLELIVSRSSLE